MEAFYNNDGILSVEIRQIEDWIRRHKGFVHEDEKAFPQWAEGYLQCLEDLRLTVNHVVSD
jgi:hypothetical protein